jgi:hypothetical protein
VNPIRPGYPQALPQSQAQAQPAQTGKSAIFALARAQAHAPQAAPPGPTAAPPVNRIAEAQADDAPQKLRRPGSIVDIRV